jgi:large subunit ribosomal protein L15e
MAKGMYHYLSEAWKKPSQEMSKMQIAWRHGNAIERVEKPLRLDRARSLGYKAKPGFVVVRVKLMRGGRTRTRPTSGRRTKRMTIKKILKMNYQGVAEQRAARRYRNLEVLNSYWVGKDGINYFYEVILVDPNHPQIKNDPDLKWILNVKGRAFRGMTSAGIKSRGLRFKGHRRLIK